MPNLVTIHQLALEISINSLDAGYFIMLLLLSADFLQNLLFHKILTGTLSVYQIAWIQIRPDVLGANCLQSLSAKDLMSSILTLSHYAPLIMFKTGHNL